MTYKEVVKYYDSSAEIIFKALAKNAGLKLLNSFSEKHERIARKMFRQFLMEEHRCPVGHVHKTVEEVKDLENGLCLMCEELKVDADSIRRDNV